MSDSKKDIVIPKKTKVSRWLIDDDPGGFRASEKLIFDVLTKGSILNQSKIVSGALNMIQFGYHREILPLLTKPSSLSPGTFRTEVEYFAAPGEELKLIDSVGSKEWDLVMRDDYKIHVLVSRYNPTAALSNYNKKHILKVISGSHRGANYGIVEIEVSYLSPIFLHPKLIVCESITGEDATPVNYQEP